VYIVKEDGEPALRSAALAWLLLDRTEALPSYQQFLTQVKDKVRRSLVVIACRD
jgi:protein transport protein SEC24